MSQAHLWEWPGQPAKAYCEVLRVLHIMSTARVLLHYLMLTTCVFRYYPMSSRLLYMLKCTTQQLPLYNYSVHAYMSRFKAMNCHISRHFHQVYKQAVEVSSGPAETILSWSGSSRLEQQWRKILKFGVGGAEVR